MNLLHSCKFCFHKMSSYVECHVITNVTNVREKQEFAALSNSLGT